MEDESIILKHYYIDAHFEHVFSEDKTKDEIYKILKKKNPWLHIDSVEEL